MSNEKTLIGGENFVRLPTEADRARSVMEQARAEHPSWARYEMRTILDQIRKNALLGLGSTTIAVPMGRCYEYVTAWLTEPEKGFKIEPTTLLLIGRVQFRIVWADDEKEGSS